jgi:hypothetical protein
MPPKAVAALVGVEAGIVDFQQFGFGCLAVAVLHLSSCDTSGHDFTLSF